MHQEVPAVAWRKAGLDSSFKNHGVLYLFQALNIEFEERDKLLSRYIWAGEKPRLRYNFHHGFEASVYPRYCKFFFITNMFLYSPAIVCLRRLHVFVRRCQDLLVHERCKLWHPELKVSHHILTNLTQYWVCSKWSNQLKASSSVQLLHCLRSPDDLSSTSLFRSDWLSVFLSLRIILKLHQDFWWSKLLKYKAHF